MIYATIVEDKIAVGMPPTYTEVAKRIPGSRYRGGTWTFPLSWAACKQLRDEFGDLLIVQQPLAEWAQAYLARRESVMAAKSGQIVAEGLDPRLLPQQALGATWLAWAGRCILADEMRAGKTPMSIQSLNIVGDSAFPVLIVCPSTNRWVWRDEFFTNEDRPGWMDEADVTVLHGSAAQRRKQLDAARAMADTGARVVVTTNWESIRTLSRLEGYGSVELSEKEKEEGPLNTFGFKTVIADEAHRALDPHSKQTRALWYLMHHAERRICLTATLIANHGGDLYSLWHAVAPEEAPVGRSKWIDRYCIAGPGRHGGWDIMGYKQDKAAEMLDILEPRFLRRTMREVRPGMPDRLEPEMRRQMLEGPQEKTYNALKKQMLAECQTEDGGKGVLVVTDPLSLTGRLLQASAGTPILDEAGGVVALGMPSVKVDILREVLSENPGEPLVVFATSRKLLALCEEQLTKDKVEWVSVHGGVDPALRAANVARFQAGHAQVILVSLSAGAEGITLNRAWRTLFLQRSWRNNVENIQAAARTDGLVDGPPIETIYHEVMGTMEERTGESGLTKEGYLQELLRDELRRK